MTPLLDAEIVLAVMSGVLFVGLAVIAVRKWGRALSHGGAVDRTAWEMYAAERGWSYVQDPLHPRMRGVHNGASVEVGARIVRRRRPRGGGYQELGTTTLRVNHRAELPPRFLLQQRTWGATLGGLVFGGPRVAVDDDIDAEFLVEGAGADHIRDVLTHVAVKKALLAMSVDLPEAVVHERAVQVKVPGMVSDLHALDHYMDLLTNVANAMREHAPQLQQPLPEATPRPAMTAADLPVRQESLTSAMNRIAGATSRTSAAVQTSALRLKPYEFIVEVRNVVEAVSRLGAPIEGRTVRGLLDRSAWRVEVTFKGDDAVGLEDIAPNDRITGMAMVDDLRQVSKVVECTAVTPAVLLEKGKPLAPVTPSPKRRHRTTDGS